MLTLVRDLCSAAVLHVAATGRPARPHLDAEHLLGRGRRGAVMPDEAAIEAAVADLAQPGDPRAAFVLGGSAYPARALLRAALAGQPPGRPHVSAAGAALRLVPGSSGRPGTARPRRADQPTVVGEARSAHLLATVATGLGITPQALARSEWLAAWDVVRLIERLDVSGARKGVPAAARLVT